MAEETWISLALILAREKIVNTINRLAILDVVQ